MEKGSTVGEKERGGNQAVGKKNPIFERGGKTGRGRKVLKKGRNQFPAGCISSRWVKKT